MCGIGWLVKPELIKTVAEQSYIKLVPWDTAVVRMICEGVVDVPKCC